MRLKAYYDAHKTSYMSPETVQLRYVEVSLTQLAGKVSVDDAQLKAYYEEQKAKTPERFHPARTAPGQPHSSARGECPPRTPR